MLIVSTSVKRYVTEETFLEDHVVFKDLVKYSEPIMFQRITIRYIYDDGKEGPLLVRTHQIFSFGLLENKDSKTGEIQGYSMPFVMFDVNEGKTETDEKFMKMIERITHLCKQAVSRNSETIRKNGRKNR